MFCPAGDPEASFTKEQMHQGKHQEYEKKLHEALLSRALAQTGGGTPGGPAPVVVPDRREHSRPQPTPAQPRDSSWPTLSGSSTSSASSTDSGFGSKSGQLLISKQKILQFENKSYISTIYIQKLICELYFHGR